MTLNFTKLNKRIIFQYGKLITNELGGASYEWLDEIEIWGAIKPYRMLSHNTHKVKENIGLYKIIVRNTNHIHKNMRIKYGNQTFKIEQIILDDKAPHLQTIYCREE